MITRIIKSIFLFCFLIEASLAGVYKWVDDSGKVHFGDEPPPQVDTQSIDIEQGPSEERVERAREEMSERINRSKKFNEEESKPELKPKSEPEEDLSAVESGNVECFTSLSNLAPVVSAETFIPITPTNLTGAQQKTLETLFGKLTGQWRGTIIDLRCSGNPSQSERHIKTLGTETIVANLNKRTSLLQIEGEATGRESANVWLSLSLQVGEFLYFSINQAIENIALDGNRVEVLFLDKSTLSFLIKRHEGHPQRRRPVAEVRQVKVLANRIELTETFFHNGVLTGSRIWKLER